MPYVDKVCSVCDHKAGRRYHNVRKCPTCGSCALVAVSPYTHQSPSACRMENVLLRKEVNFWRMKCGAEPKYVDLPE